MNLLQEFLIKPPQVEIYEDILLDISALTL